MDELRTKRVAETMREELSELIRFELDDPRLTQVEVAEVHVSPDLRKADVVVTAPGTEAMDALESARHFLRRQLIQRMDLYRMPELHFVAALLGAETRSVRKLQRRLRRGRSRE